MYFFIIVLFVFVFIYSNTPGFAIPVTSGLVSYYEAEGNANDTQGLNNAALQGDATFASGKIGQAFSLDGSGDFVQVLSPSGLPLGSSSRTISLWMRTDQNYAVSAESGIFQYGNTSTSQMFGLITSGNAPQKAYFFGHGVDVADGYNDSDGTSSSTTNLLQDTWYHLAVTYDGATIRLYQDGSQIAFRSGSLSTVLNANGLTIGNRPPTGYFDGLIDDVAIYDRTLSPAEISTIYSAGSNPVPEPATVLLFSSALLGLIRFKKRFIC